MYWNKHHFFTTSNKFDGTGSTGSTGHVLQQSFDVHCIEKHSHNPHMVKGCCGNKKQIGNGITHVVGVALFLAWWFRTSDCSCPATCYVVIVICLYICVCTHILMFPGCGEVVWWVSVWSGRAGADIFLLFLIPHLARVGEFTRPLGSATIIVPRCTCCMDHMSPCVTSCPPCMLCMWWHSTIHYIIFLVSVTAGCGSATALFCAYHSCLVFMVCNN